MSTVSERQHDTLRQQINDSLQKASGHKEKLKRTHSRYGIANIILGALATFTAGQAALLGQAAVTGGWRVTCAVASGLALGATVVAGVQRQIVDPEILTQASECVSRLRGLKVDTIGPEYDLEEARRRYQQVLAEFSGIEC